MDVYLLEITMKLAKDVQLFICPLDQHLNYNSICWPKSIDCCKVVRSTINPFKQCTLEMKLLNFKNCTNLVSPPFFFSFKMAIADCQRLAKL